MAELGLVVHAAGRRAPVLGPERLPGAVRWATGILQRARDAVNGAADQAKTQFGPVLAEMREPLAVVAEARAQLRDLSATTSRLLIDPPRAPADPAPRAAPAESAHPPFDPRALRG